MKFVLFERTLKITSKLSFSFWFPCFVFEMFHFWYANYTYDVVYEQCHIGEAIMCVFLPRHQKWFRFIITKIYNILRYVIACILRHIMCNLHIKETEISQIRSKEIKNWKITYSVILSVLSNKTNWILGFSSPLKIILVFIEVSEFITTASGGDSKWRENWRNSSSQW